MFRALQCQLHARSYRKLQREPLTALLAKPEIHDRVSRFFPADHGRHISARLFGIPDLIGKEPPFMRVEKLCMAVRIRALSDHASLLEIVPSSLIRRNRENSNKTFVLSDSRQIPVGSRQSAKGAASSLDQFPLHRIHHGFQTVVRPELLIDVMEMVSQGLRADSEFLRNFGRIATRSEHL